MKQYIDKSAVVAEIEKRIKGVNRLINIGCSNKEEFLLESRLIEKIHTYEDILDYINTLEVKETGTVWHSFDEVLPQQGSDICVYWDRDEIITTGIWEESEKPKYASKWAYTSDLLKDK